MPALDHWHPVARCKDVQQKPHAVRLCGRELVLFRSKSGVVGALEDQCCHRGMRLSVGKVDESGCLVCPYHGWKYHVDGQLETSSVPKLTHQTEFFLTREEFGLTWIKSSKSEVPFPELDFEGHEYIGTLFHTLDAPLEVALDNFTEVEHTGEAHAYFGYSQEDTAKIETKMSVTKTTTSVVNKGVQRPYPWFVKPFLSIRPGDYFYNTWVTYFSPVYTVYDQFWTTPDGKHERKNRLRIAIFFNPLDDKTTQMVTLIYGKPFLGRFFFRHVVRHLITAGTNMELLLDKQVVDNLADKSPSLRGKKLGRFDQPLIQNRRRIDKIYRGMGEHSDASTHPGGPAGPQPPGSDRLPGDDSRERPTSGRDADRDVSQTRNPQHD
ncbi:MAG: Rieske 2Fe-2S domain-containing protein [Planctomycetota bacterium]